MKKDSLIQGNIGKALLRNERNGVSNDYDAAYNLSVSCCLHFSDSTEILAQWSASSGFILPPGSSQEWHL